MRIRNNYSRIITVWLLIFNILVINMFSVVNASAQSDTSSKNDSSTKNSISQTEKTVDYYVSPNGKDSNSGTKAKPFATINKAQEVIRKNAVKANKVNVILRGGEYYLDSTLSFNNSDSGNNGATITYKNYPGEQPIITGGKAIEGWKLYKGNIYMTNVDDNWDFNTLYENGERSVIARYPNITYNRAIAVNENNTVSSSKFSFSDKDIPYIENIDNLEVFMWPGGSDGTWNWGTNLLKVKNLDFTQKSVELDGTTEYQIGTGSRYLVQGALELLDSPGEFFLDKKSNVLYYWPKNKEINLQEIVAPKTKDIIMIKGTSANDPVKNISFEGITIRSSDRGGSGIRLENVQNITIKDCKINGTGENGIHMTGFAQNNKIYGNSIYDIGNTGVSIGGSELYINKKNTISNNHIYNTGRIVGHGSGIQLWQSGENTITNNLIHHTPRYAISLKGPNPNSLIGQVINGVLVTAENQREFRSTQDNLIAYNDVSQANLDSQDTGVIEAWNPDTGNIFRNNFIHDSEIHFSFGTALYFDDLNDTSAAIDNIFYNLQKSGQGKLESLVFAKGIGSKVINNFGANNNVSKGAVHTQDREGSPNREVTVEKNIFYNSGKNPYSFDNWAEDRFTSADYNLLFNTDGKYGIQGLQHLNVQTIQEWKDIQNKKYDQNSRMADPKFIDAPNGDLRLSYDSIAYGMGIHDIDMESIGLTADFKYTDSNDPLATIFVKDEKGNKGSANISLKKGQNTKLKVTGRSKTGYILDITKDKITYKSDSPKVATVDSKGKITAKGKGVAKITVTVQKGNVVKNKVMFVVVNDEFNRIELRTDKEALSVGESSVLQIYGRSELGQYMKPDIKDITFKSSNPKVLTVDKLGIVTAVAEGTAEITATSKKIGTGKLKIPTVDSLLDKVTITADKTSLAIGEITNLGVKAFKQNGNEIANDQLQIKYEISDSSVLELTQGTKVKALKKGFAEVKAIVTQYGIVKEQSVGILVKGDAGAQAWKLQNYKNADGIITSTSNGIVVTGNGDNIWGKEDDFTYAYQDISLAEDKSEVSISAKINSQKDIGSKDAAVGVMLRDSNTAGSNNVILRILPGGGLRMTYRNAENPETWYLGGPDIKYPAELKLTKVGDLFTGYYKEGDKWIKVGEINVTMDNEILAGVGLMANAQGKYTEATLSDVKIVDGSQTWKEQNYKNSQGIVTYSNNGFTITTNGDNIWGAEDDCTYVYEEVKLADAKNEVSISAKVNSLKDIGAKDAAVGVMIRDGNTAGSNNVILRILPGGGLRFTYRNTEYPETWYIGGPDITYPAELKLTKVGDLFTGYYKEGDKWIKVGEINVTMDNEILAGVAVMANAQGKYIEAKVADVTIVK